MGSISAPKSAGAKPPRLLRTPRKPCGAGSCDRCPGLACGVVATLARLEQSLPPKRRLHQGRLARLG